MRKGICLKCGQQTVHMARNGLQLGERLQTQLRPHTEPGYRGMFVPHETMGLWQFVCTTCGYLEMHVLDAKALGFIATSWPRVVPQPPKPGG